MLSRRARGLSIGVNLNPDGACNFGCVYCQVDRSAPPALREVDLQTVRAELTAMFEAARDGTLFAEPPFSSLPPEQHCIRDIAFSGDGEPTASKHFLPCVQLVAELKQQTGLADTKIVLITDACYLTRPRVVQALEVLDRNRGEIWAKLDAGTEAYFRQVNRPNFSLAHVVENLSAAARVRPIVIQSLFLKLHGQPPAAAEVAAYCERLNEIVRSGGRIARVQVYTVARPPAEAWVTALTDEEVDALAEQVRQRTGLVVEAFYGAQM
ncbi:MAG TPA: radical SAM protein [Phycisphaerae bacterium]|nr:radical SAM protein [Phycisphaerae bacterium]HNU45606.1 radical SAM protein [Phycisphaerae bacterium]